MSIQEDLHKTYSELDRTLTVANTRVNHIQRNLFKNLIRLNNQIKKPPHIAAQEAKGKFYSELARLGFLFIDPKIAKNFKTQYNQIISTPTKKLEIELDLANTIIEKLEHKDLISYYEESKKLGLSNANNKWIQKIRS
jgi:hypothetical protein